jgi:uncharacterized protein YuzE
VFEFDDGVGGDDGVADDGVLSLRWCLELFGQSISSIGQSSEVGDLLFMNNATKMTYFEQEDVLHLAISDEPESNSIEIAPNVTAELNEAGELIGIEILRASSFIRDAILESAQGKILGISSAKSA